MEDTFAAERRAVKRWCFWEQQIDQLKGADDKRGVVSGRQNGRRKSSNRHILKKWLAVRFVSQHFTDTFRMALIPSASKKLTALRRPFKLNAHQESASWKKREERHKKEIERYEKQLKEVRLFSELNFK